MRIGRTERIDPVGEAAPVEPDTDMDRMEELGDPARGTSSKEEAEAALSRRDRRDSLDCSRRACASTCSSRTSVSLSRRIRSRAERMVGDAESAGATADILAGREARRRNFVGDRNAQTGRRRGAVPTKGAQRRSQRTVRELAGRRVVPAQQAEVDR